MADESRPLTEQELSLAYEGPAVSVNRVLITIGVAGVRIAFVEHGKDVPPQFRTAIVMPIQDAISFKNVLAEMLTDIERQIAVREEIEKSPQEELAEAVAKRPEDG